MEKFTRVKIEGGIVGRKADFVKITGAQVGAAAAAYGAGDVIGDTSPIKVELLNGKYGVSTIQSVIIKDLAAQNAAIDVIFFDSNPSNTTFTDNGALDISDSDIDKVLGTVSVAALDYDASADSSVATTINQNILLKGASDEPCVWVVLVSRGTPTYVADGLSIAFGVLQ